MKSARIYNNTNGIARNKSSSRETEDWEIIPQAFRRGRPGGRAGSYLSDQQKRGPLQRRASKGTRVLVTMRMMLAD
jgi:hypothetical protein